MPRLRAGVRRGQHPSRPVRGLLTVVLAFVAAAPAVAGTGPIHRDDILVNNETTGTQVNPRVIMAPGGPGDSVGEGGAGTSLTYTIGTMWSDWDGGASLLQYRELDLDGVPIGLQQSFSITSQWENMVGDLALLRREQDGALNLAFGVEIAGVDASDPALLLPASGLEYAVVPPSANTGFQADVAIRYAAEFGRLGEVHSSSHDVAGNPDPSIVFANWNAGLGSPTVLQHVTTQEVDEISSSSVGFPSLELLHLSFGGPLQQGFLVVWESYGSAGNDTSLSSIQARFVSLDGVPVGSQFQVNSYTDSFQSRPDVAALDDGTFVVVWQSDGSFGDDDSFTSIQARRFSSDGTPLGPELQVNNEILGQQYYPAVAAQEDGGFVVAWTDTPVANTTIAARQFLAGGVPADDQFQVNTMPGVSVDDPPSIDALGREFVVVWIANGDVYLNGSFLRIFGDGFEGGDTTRWSAAVP